MSILNLASVIPLALLITACNHVPTEWRTGGIYSTEDGKGQFGVVKVLVLEPDAVHIRVYQQKFASRPTSVDPNTLTLGKLGDKDFSIGHVPLSRKSFASWKPVFIIQEQVQDRELEGYRVWKQANGGVF
jgi:hypothetical protein